MKKRYIIMGILICIIAFLGYLQYGHEEQAVNTMVSTSGAFYKQEFDVIANKLFILDKEKYAEEDNEHGGKMIYQQDWLMRQIEAMIQAILAVALGISANEQTATQIEDSSYGKMLEKMIDDGDICAAEDLLFNDLDQSDSSWLQIALDFYSKLNNCSDDYLAMHDFSREEIDQGLRYICTLFGYDFLVSN